MRSESLPQTGAKRNCMAEKEAISAPMVNPPALKFFAKSGSSGSTIPNPMRSMKTVRKMMNTDGFFISTTHTSFDSRARTQSEEEVGEERLTPIKAPNTKLQTPEKLETPSSKLEARAAVWSLELGISLVFGAWLLVFRFQDFSGAWCWGIGGSFSHFSSRREWCGRVYWGGSPDLSPG